MNNPFENFYKDLFNQPDFVKYAYFNGVKVACIASQITTDQAFTAYGVDAGVSFYLRIRAKDYTPTNDDVVVFNNVTYQVDNYSLDGQGMTYKVNLKSE